MRLMQNKCFSGVLIPIVVSVTGTLIALFIWDKKNESPSLEIADTVSVVKGSVEIPLRTRSTIPVVVFGYWVRIRPLASAILTDEKPLEIDADALPFNKWVWTPIESFQVKRDDVSKLPIRINYLNNERSISVEIRLGYGDPENPNSLSVGSFEMAPGTGNGPETGTKRGRGTGGNFMSSQKPAIVYVHGIGQHPAGYSDDWFAALQPHLTTSVEKYEVVWSDIVNARAMSAEKDATGVRVRTAAEETFRSELIKELESRKLRNKQTEADTNDDKPKGLFWGDSFFLDDFVRYMVSEPTRKAILSRFDDVFLPLLEEGRTIHVISHSWGTVAYEGLRRHDGEQLGGHVANLFVLGSALSFRLNFRRFHAVQTARLR